MMAVTRKNYTTQKCFHYKKDEKNRLAFINHTWHNAQQKKKNSILAGKIEHCIAR